MIPDTAPGASRAYSYGMLWPIALAALLALTLFVATVATVAALSLRSDVAALADRARKSMSAENSLRKDLAAFKAGLAKAQPSAVVPGAVAPTVAAQTVVAEGVRPVPGGVGPAAHVVKVRADDSSQRECVFLSGDPYRLADCIRREEGAMGRSARHASYR